MTYQFAFATCNCLCTSAFFAFGIFYQQTWRHYAEDTNIACFLAPTFACSICVVFIVNLQLLVRLIRRLYRTVMVYGCVRYSVFIVFACFFSYFFVVFILDGSALFVWNIAKTEVVRRVEDSIIQVQEDRTHFIKKVASIKHIKLSPHRPVEERIYDVFRYKQEDVEIACEHEILWVPYSCPTKSDFSAVWRRDGKPFSWSERYTIEVTMQKASEDEESFARIVKWHNMSVYRIVTKLSIKLLKPFDFGVYTCHAVDLATHNLLEWNYLFMNGHRVIRKRIQSESTPNKSFSQIEYLILKYLTFEVSYMAVVHYNLREVKRNYITVTAPPGAILSLIPNHWHNEYEDNIQVEYYINGMPADQVCNQHWFHCSKIVLLYWMIAKDCLFNSACIPPLKWSFPRSENSGPLSLTRLFSNCLCEAAYGVHHVEIYRQHYNSKRKRHELVEIHYPHDLIIVPREQELLNVHVNYSNRDNMTSSGQTYPTVNEMLLIENLARPIFNYYLLKETILCGVVLLLLLLFTLVLLTVVTVVARIARRWILNGKMLSGKETHQQHYDMVKFDPIKTLSLCVFDIYLSFSDTEMNFIVEKILPLLEGTLGLKVCFRERDIPPNVYEMSGVQTAIKNSKRFIIFLSPDYLEDGFREKVEAMPIFEVASTDRNMPLQNTVLVVKLSPCRFPDEWTNSCCVHDWTTACLTREEHEYRLARWLLPVGKRGVMAEAKDVLYGACPLWIFLVVVLAIFVLISCLR